MTWNVNRLYEILAETTVQVRKGEVVHGTPELVEQIKAGAEKLEGSGVVTIDAMPAESDLKSGLEIIDMELLLVGVDADEARKHRAELVEIMNSYPRSERLRGGPSYIEVGGEIGDQGAAFQLFAVGQVLGFWKVITPASLGIHGQQATDMAGSGFVMISGYHPD